MKRNRFKRLINTFVSNWRIMVVVIVLTTISSYLLSAYGLTKHYITNMNVIITDGSGNSDPVNAATAVLLFRSPNMYNTLNDGLETKHTYEEYDNAFAVTQEPGTGFLKIEVDASTPEKSLALANRYLDAMPEVLGGYIEKSGITIISEPVAPTTPVFPNDGLFVLIGLAAGVLISIIGIFIIWALDNTITSADNLSEQYNIPVLGELMDFDTEIDYLGR